ncbi:MAG: AMIN domain-containing protein, partial [Candidatus Hydrogenedentes bacterium]|nr:AMIN domain-containing protein [Candidatus Hydrogenedentota bacterium]
MLRLSPRLAMAALLAFPAVCLPAHGELREPGPIPVADAGQEAPTAPALAVDPASELSPDLQPASIDRRKRDLVRAVLDNQSRTADEPLFLDAVNRAHALVDMELTGTAERLVLTLRAAGDPHVDLFTLDDGHRLVIDLYDTVNLHPGKAIHLSSQPHIRQVRTSLYALEPQFVSRVVVDFATPCAFRLDRSPGAIQVHFAPLPAESHPQAAFGSGLVAELSHQERMTDTARCRFEEMAKRLGYAFDSEHRDLAATIQQTRRDGDIATAAALQTGLDALVQRRAALHDDLRAQLNRDIDAAQARIARQHDQADQVINALRAQVTDTPTAAETLAQIEDAAYRAQDTDFARLAAVERALVDEEATLVADVRALPESTVVTARAALDTLNAELARLRDDSRGTPALLSTPPIAQTSEVGLRVLETLRADASAAWEAAHERVDTLTNELAALHTLIQPAAPVPDAEPAVDTPDEPAPVATDPATGFLSIPINNLSFMAPDRSLLAVAAASGSTVDEQLARRAESRHDAPAADLEPPARSSASRPPRFASLILAAAEEEAAPAEEAPA